MAITGATGHCGRHAIESLLAKGVPATDIVGVGRHAEKLGGLGVTARHAQYEDMDSLTSAFAGAAGELLRLCGITLGMVTQ
jgi:NAD(P)H dehydrogenase (quinone)